MKKHIKAFIAVLTAVFASVFALSFAVSADSVGVFYDFTGSTDSATAEGAETYLSRASDRLGYPVIMLVTDDTDGKVPRQYAFDFYKENYQEQYSSALVLIYNTVNKTVSTNAFGSAAQNDFDYDTLEEIDEYMQDYINSKPGMYGAAAYELYHGISQMETYYYSYDSSEDNSNSIHISFEFSLFPVIAIIVISVVIAVIYKGNVLRKYRNLDTPSIGTYNDFSQTVYYEKRDMFIREYTVSDD